MKGLRKLSILFFLLILNSIAFGVDPILTHGGLLGAVTDSGIKIWARSDSPATFRAEYKPQASPTWVRSDGVSLAVGGDFTGVVTLSGLSADTTYDYRILLNDVAQTGSQSTFKTLKRAGQPALFSFAVGADTQEIHPFDIFDRIAAKTPDFMLLLGDQIYADSNYADYDPTPFPVASQTPTYPTDYTQAYYEAKYRTNWAKAPFQAFMRRTPLFMIWDDHEIKNNWDNGQTGIYLNASPAFDEYQGSHNPAPRVAGGKGYTFRVADCDFYVLDTRSFRSDGAAPDTSAKTLLGTAQKADLKDWLLSSTGRFKFVASPTPWNSFMSRSSDSWHGYRTERAELSNFIRANGVRGVVLLTGDQHEVVVARLKEIAPFYLYEFSPTPLATSNLSYTDPAQDPTQVLFSYNSSYAYGFFRVDTTVAPAKLDFYAYNQLNTELYHLAITENDISPPPLQPIDMTVPEGGLPGTGDVVSNNEPAPTETTTPAADLSVTDPESEGGPAGSGGELSPETPAVESPPAPEGPLSETPPSSSPFQRHGGCSRVHYTP